MKALHSALATGNMAALNAREAHISIRSMRSHGNGEQTTLRPRYLKRGGMTAWLVHRLSPMKPSPAHATFPLNGSMAASGKISSAQ